MILKSCNRVEHKCHLRLYHEENMRHMWPICVRVMKRADDENLIAQRIQDILVPLYIKMTYYKFKAGPLFTKRTDVLPQDLAKS